MNFLTISQFALFATAGDKVGVWQAIKNAFIWVLELMYSFTELIGIPNWVLAMFLFTLVVKLLTQPLQMKQLRSSRRMAMLQPEVEELKRRFASNPQRQQQETMKLYKAHNASPTAGCLPMLIQMPILIALFQAVRFYVPADTTNFSFWFISNLSMTSAEVGAEVGFLAGWILPVLAAGSTFLQQFLQTANRKDQQQRIMMLMMPVMFLFFVRSFPVLMSFYWIFYSLIGAAITFPIMKHWEKIDKEKIEAMRREKEEEAERRRAKKMKARQAAEEEKAKKRKSAAKPAYQTTESDFAVTEIEDDIDAELDESLLDEDELARREEEAAFQQWALDKGIRITKKKMRVHPWSTEDEVVELALLPSGKEVDLPKLKKQFSDWRVQEQMQKQFDGSVFGKATKKLENYGKKRQAAKQAKQEPDDPDETNTEGAAAEKN